VVTAKATFRGAVTALALPLALSGCDPQDWITDFKQQPSVGTWQKLSMDPAAGDTMPFRGNPQGSVPVTGITLASWEVSYAPTMQAVDSMSRLPNPVAVDARSLANGHRLYQVNCAVCHGDLGDGNGTLRQLSPMYGFAPPINGAPTQARSDGYIWGVLRNGRGLMGSFNRLSEAERWDVVNYVRGLQGRHAVATGAIHFAGQAAAFSAVTPVAPQTWIPHVRPTTEGTVPKPEKAADDHGEHR
jgi:mono/diheme cytochrome c family protein